MAHQTDQTTPASSDISETSTRDTIDQLAAAATTAAAAAATTSPPSPANAPRLEIALVLAYGATGAPVERLYHLLVALGYSQPRETPPVVDEQLLADVAAAQASLEVSEPDFTPVEDLGAGVQGTLVGQATFNALYAAAAAKLEPSAEASISEDIRN